jgi:alanyl-tRNA synthetase
MDTKIVSCEKTNHEFKVLLDKTIFRYKAGGQDCDKGQLRKDDIVFEVVDVEEENGKTIHIVKGKGSLDIGDEVLCVLDWERRYTLMKLHTAEHIFYKSLAKRLPDLELKKLWLTFDDDKREGNGTIVIETSKPLDWKILVEAETEVNKIIYENRSIKTYISNVKDLTKDVRIKESLLKRMNQVRIVEVEKFDKAACSGTHVERTGEIMFFKITSIEKKNAQSYHLNFKVGEDALNFALTVSNQVLWKAQSIGYNPDEVIYVLEKHEKLRETLKGLKTQLLNTIPQDIERNKEIVHNIPIYYYVCRGLEVKELTMLGRRLKKKIEGNFIAILVGTNETASFIIASKGVNLDVSKILKEFLANYDCKGGGKPDFAIYGIKKPNNINELLNNLVNRFRLEISKILA